MREKFFLKKRLNPDNMEMINKTDGNDKPSLRCTIVDSCCVEVVFRVISIVKNLKME